MSESVVADSELMSKDIQGSTSLEFTADVTTIVEVAKTEEVDEGTENKVDVTESKDVDDKVEVVKVEDLKEVEVQDEKVNTDQIKVEEVKAEEVNVEIKTEDVKVEEVKVEEVKTEEVKEEEIVEEVKAEDVKAEEVKAEELQKENEEVKVEEPKKEEIKIEEPKKEEIKVEEPKKEEAKIEELKKEEVKAGEPKKEEAKVEEPKKEEPKKEEVKVEESKKEETKVEEPKKWASAFSTNNPVSTTDSGIVKPSESRSLFATQAKEPIKLSPAPSYSSVSPTSSTAAASPASTHSNVSSYFASRAGAWESRTPSSTASTSKVDVVSMAQQRDRKYSAYVAPSTFSYSETRAPSKSVYHNPSAGHTPGSMASFIGNSLGVQHQGRSTGLLKPRLDKEEENARVWHTNRGANTQLSNVFKSAVDDTLKKDSNSVDNAAQRYLQRRLTESK